MPVELLVVAEMPGHPGIQTTERAAEVDVMAPWELNQTQLTYPYLAAGRKTQRQGVATGWAGVRLGDLEVGVAINNTPLLVVTLILPRKEKDLFVLGQCW